MKQFRDPTSQFIRAATVTFMTFGVVIEEIRSRSWASVTFTGARHELTFRIEGAGAAAAADEFLAGLEAREFDLRGHIMADIALVSEERNESGDWVRISLEALTVEDA